MQESPPIFLKPKHYTTFHARTFGSVKESVGSRHCTVLGEVHCGDKNACEGLAH